MVCQELQKSLLTGEWYYLYFCYKALKIINETENGLVVCFSYIALEIYKQLLGTCSSSNTSWSFLTAVDLQASTGVLGCPNSCLNRRGEKILLSFRWKQSVRSLLVMCFQWPIKVLKYSPAQPPGSSCSLKWWTSIKLLQGFYYQLQIMVWPKKRQISMFLWVAHFPCLAIKSSPVGQCAKRSLWYCVSQPEKLLSRGKSLLNVAEMGCERKDIIFGSDCHWRLNIDRSNVLTKVWRVNACASR